MPISTHHKTKSGGYQLKFLLLAFVIFVFPVADVWACSCMLPANGSVDMRRIREPGTLVFEGEVESVHVKQSVLRIMANVRVHEVIFGSSGKRIVVETALHGATCGVQLKVGKRMSWLARKGDGGKYRLILCDQLFWKHYEKEIRQKLKAGK